MREGALYSGLNLNLHVRNFIMKGGYPRLPMILKVRVRSLGFSASGTTELLVWNSAKY
jgi:hypothetical protein